MMGGCSRDYGWHLKAKNLLKEATLINNGTLGHSSQPIKCFWKELVFIFKNSKYSGMLQNRRRRRLQNSRRFILEF